jgi:hypothetical protein
LYEARVDVGLKHRLPTELHCVCVGGISDVVSWTQSLTVGRGKGSADGRDARPPADAATAAKPTASDRPVNRTILLMKSPFPRFA